jgi:hypothetical protein
LSSREKLLEKIRRRRGNNVSLEDFEALVNHFGCIREGGKHTMAMIDGYPFPLPYKRENPVKSCYMKDLLRIIESLDK